MPQIFAATDDDGDHLHVAVHMDGYYVSIRDCGTGTTGTVVLPGEWAVMLAHAILGTPDNHRCACGKPAAHLPESSVRRS